MTEEGWIAARQFVDALKAAGPDFTWKNLIGAWNQQKAYTNGGLVPPIDWTRQHGDPTDGVANRSELQCVNFLRIQDGKFVGIYDDGGAKPWVCFHGQQPDTWEQPDNLQLRHPNGQGRRAVTLTVERRLPRWRSTRGVDEAAAPRTPPQTLRPAHRSSRGWRDRGRRRMRAAFDGHEPAARREHAAHLAEAGVEVGPVVDGGERPHDARPAVGNRQCFGRARARSAALRPVGESARPAASSAAGSTAGHRRAERGGAASRDARPAADVDQTSPAGDRLSRMARSASSSRPRRHAERGDEAAEPGEARRGGRGGWEQASSFGHAPTLTVEPGFKSSGHVTETTADHRRGRAPGRRRHLGDPLLRAPRAARTPTPACRASGATATTTLRRLVFIGMLQDAGLALDDIDGILHAGDVARVEGDRRRRLAARSTTEIARLQHARDYLAGALLCRYDHPRPTARSWAPRSTAASPMTNAEATSSAADLTAAIRSKEISARAARAVSRPHRPPRSRRPRRPQRGGHARRRARARRGRGGRRARSPAATPSGRCTACRSRSRTRSRPRASARPAARSSCADHVPAADAAAVARAARPPARSCSARPTCRAGRATCRPTTRCSARRTTRGTRPRTSRAARRAARPPPSPPASPRFELGTDIGGSVRIPSHCCGVFGLKPSYGVVPSLGYLDHVGGGTTDADINVFGPIARAADDLDLLLVVLAGPAPEDALAWRVELPAPRGRRRWPGSASRRGSTTQRARSTPSTSALLRAVRPTRSPTPARRSRTRIPPVDFREQVDVVHAADRGRPCRRACPTRWPSGSPARTSPGSATTSDAPRSARSGPSGSSATTCCSCPAWCTPAFELGHTAR